MKYLIIKAFLADGRISSYNFDFMFDGLIYSAYAKAYRSDLTGKPFNYEDTIDFDLPIEKSECGVDWYYLCSRAFFDNLYGEDIEFYHKKYDLENAEKYVKGGFKDIDHGRFRAYRNALLIKCTKEITWYCKGDKTEIKKLLSYITSIGSKHNVGYGLIREWKVEECENIIFDSKMRPIPNKNGNAIKRIRPPYHNFLNERMCQYDSVCFSALQEM